MKTLPRSLIVLGFATFAFLACKREKLDFDQNLGSVAGNGFDVITKSTTIRDEKEANARAIEELDKEIEELSNKLNQSQNLSVEQKAELSQKLAAAQSERQTLLQKQTDLENKLSETQKALDEQKKKNDQLKKELEDAQKGASTPTTEPDKPATTTNAQFGPVLFKSADKCLSVTQKSKIDGATLEAAPCTYEDHQLFMVEETSPDGDDFRLIPVHSQKCLSLSGTGVNIGDKLQQGTCLRKESALSERFYIIQVNPQAATVVLQSAKTEMCLVKKADGSIAQDKCATEASIYTMATKP